MAHSTLQGLSFLKFHEKLSGHGCFSPFHFLEISTSVKNSHF
jgi:hypothetical protein